MNCCFILNILHQADTSELINRCIQIDKLNMSFSCMTCGYVNKLYIAYVNNYLYDLNEILFIPALKYININKIIRLSLIIDNIVIYIYLSKVSDMFSTKHVVRIDNLDVNFIVWKMQTVLVNIMIYVHIYRICLCFAIHILYLGEKPLKCDLCNVIVYVILHISTHTREKSYKCNKCGMVERNELYSVVYMYRRSQLLDNTLVSNDLQ